MIVGVGTDLCDVRRIEAACRRHGERFPQRILGPQEMQLYGERLAQSESRAMQFLATRFAVKEAVSKALGTGMRHPMGWQRCETLNQTGGQPVLVFHDDLKTLFEQRQWRAHVSVSDDTHHVLAFVVLEAIH